MEIVPYMPDQAGEVAEFYNCQVENVPYCHPTVKEDWTAYMKVLVENPMTSCSTAITGFAPSTGPMGFPTGLSRD